MLIMLTHRYSQAGPFHASIRNSMWRCLSRVFTMSPFPLHISFLRTSLRSLPPALPPSSMLPLISSSQLITSQASLLGLSCRAKLLQPEPNSETRGSSLKCFLFLAYGIFYVAHVVTISIIQKINFIVKNKSIAVSARLDAQHDDMVINRIKQHHHLQIK